jgi:hypothetical protein
MGRASLKHKQINCRWTTEDVRAINAIAEKEERSQSEVVRFFVHFGMESFRTLGSFERMKGAQIISVLDENVRRESEQRIDVLRKAEARQEMREDEYPGPISYTRGERKISSR